MKGLGCFETSPVLFGLKEGGVSGRTTGSSSSRKRITLSLDVEL